ncbi:hypothetical protein [Olivibacter sp. XZL3]|uniref:hypothetical protein n=1 Tax=Olivibacter sp. XZL3 TaxID=1735116 RepID=UPI0010651D86|nr:hypothetical protein [Olivibacter sp. XZL3]
MLRGRCDVNLFRRRGFTDLSWVGYYGKRPTTIARYLIENNMYDFLGTDLHHERQLHKIIKYVKSGNAYKDLGRLTLRNYELL